MLEHDVALQMKKKGYRYIASFTEDDQCIYFKTAMDIGPYMRNYPTTKMTSCKDIDVYIEETK